MRRLRSGLVAAAVLVVCAPAASAQTANRAVIVLDASKSMNEDAGNGGTRLDAAKQAVDQLLERLPSGAPLGLRVYGSKIAETSRAQACRDTELTVPVGPLDKEALRGAVQSLEGKGRTPIGNSLLAVPDDLGQAEGRRTVILVSDGGDNCAPPDPCKAAEEVSRRGVDLSISVVGLQVNERVRRQLECIAKAGGGTYVDVDDASKLGDELAAALARAFRAYEPAGTEVAGGAAAGQAVALKEGLFQDAIAPGSERWYAIDVPEGRRLLTSVSAIPGYEDEGQGEIQTELFGPGDDRLSGDGDVLYGRSAGERGRVRSQVRSTDRFAGTDGLPPGRYVLRVGIGAGLRTEAVPVELGIQLLAQGESVGLTRAAGELGPAETPAPPPEPTAAAPAPAEESGSGPLPAVLAGVAGLGVGLGAALVLTRRRPA